MNMKQPCAWGAVKALRAVVNLPLALRSSKVKKATALTVEFLLSRDLSKADYPYTTRERRVVQVRFSAFVHFGCAGSIARAG